MQQIAYKIIKLFKNKFVCKSKFAIIIFCLFRQVATMKYLRNEKVIKALGKRIRSLRNEKNMSMEQLAYSTGIEYSQLSRIELGQVNTSVSHVAAIAETLKVPIASLFDF